MNSSIDISQIYAAEESDPSPLCILEIPYFKCFCIPEFSENKRSAVLMLQFLPIMPDIEKKRFLK